MGNDIIMAVYLCKDPPFFESRPFEGLMPKSYTSLHCKVFFRVEGVVWTFNFIRVPDISAIHLHALARLKVVA